eukprot:CAMPEP_0194544490 /NCGR_PEP_ID=MMETSP0253-20130528/87650_1 /TAXON_ID=2966 /ORGANISM="Noctiluca scintillans" /LENGTH=40 /DNA_ID= /DNA_START= /DNA_END= /DNA_ORIENTATION=
MASQQSAVLELQADFRKPREDSRLGRVARQTQQHFNFYQS